MKPGKFVWMNIVMYVSVLTSLIASLKYGLEPLTFSTAANGKIWMTFTIITTYFIINILVGGSYISSRALVKKNLLRIPFFLMVALLIIQIIFDGYVRYMWGSLEWLWWLNILWILVIIVIISRMSKELFRLVQRLFTR